MAKIIDKLFDICNGIVEERDIPASAKALAKKHGYIIVVGGSDDLFYVFGAKCYMTERIEHSYGFSGDSLDDLVCICIS